MLEEMADMVRPQKLPRANRILARFLGTPFTSYPQRLGGKGVGESSRRQQLFKPGGRQLSCKVRA